MIIKYGDMWSRFEEVDHFYITTNATIRKDGALVMGRGIARQAKQRLKGIDFLLGREIQNVGELYGLIRAGSPTPVGGFQVKYHWSDKADPALIAYSAIKLREEALRFADQSFCLNYPGIGNGRLRVAEVAPILEVLPDNVEVWAYDRNQLR